MDVLPAAVRRLLFSQSEEFPVFHLFRRALFGAVSGTGKRFPPDSNDAHLPAGGATATKSRKTTADQIHAQLREADARGRCTHVLSDLLPENRDTSGCSLSHVMLK